MTLNNPSARKFPLLGVILIIAGLALSLGVIAAIGIAIYNNAHTNAVQAVSGDLNEKASAAVERVTSFFDSRVADANMLAADLDVQSLAPDRVDRALQAFSQQHPMYVGLAVYGLDGEVVATNFRKVFDPSKNPAYQQAIQGKPGVSDPFKSLLLKDDLVIAVFAPVVDEHGKVIAVVNTSFNANYLNNLLGEAQRGTTGDVYLVNHEGIAITPSRYSDLLRSTGLNSDRFELAFIPYTYGVQQGLAGRSGVEGYADIRGMAVIGAYMPIQSLGWVILDEQDIREAFAELDRLKNLVVGVCLGAASLAVIIAAVSILLLVRWTH